MCTGKSGHIVWLKYFAHFWKSSLKSLIPIEPMSITLWGLLESALFISERNLPVLMELYFWTFQDWDLLILENIKKKHFIYSKISRYHAKAACMPCMAKAKAELLQKTQKREFENYIFNKYKFLCCSCLSWNTSWSLDNKK